MRSDPKPIETISQIPHLGKHGMVRERKRSGNNLPGGVPLNFLLIDEDAHELGDGERWVGIVQLNRNICRSTWSAKKEEGGIAQM